MKKMKTLEYVISAAVGAFFSFFGVLAILLALLIECKVMDRDCKKITMYVLIFVGFGIDCMISYVTATLNVDMPLPLLFSAIIASWLVISELISITENCEVIALLLLF